MAAIKKVAGNVYLVSYGEKKAATVTFGKDAGAAVDAAYVDKSSKVLASKGGYVPRGKDDARLLQLHQVLSDSPNKWQFVLTRRNFIGGLGIGPHQEEVVKGELKYTPIARSPQYREWHERLELDDYLAASSYQIAFGGDLFVRLALGPNKKVESLKVVDTFQIRARKPKDGETRILEYWISAKFGHQKAVKEEDCVKVPAFDPLDPTKYPVAIIHVRAPIPGQTIYGFEPWWGTERVTKITNRVPDYYEAAFDNGFFVTHHVDIPDNYFKKEGLTEDDEEILKKEVLDQIANTLMGLEKANKILFTFSKLSVDGRIIEGVKITPLKNPINDEAFLKMFESINLIQASGHGVRADLAGVAFNGGLGTSGKELATSANYAQDFMTHFDKMMLLKPVRIAQRIDGIELENYLCVYRISSYTYDVTPESSSQNPNTEEPKAPTQQP